MRTGRLPDGDVGYIPADRNVPTGVVPHRESTPSITVLWIHHNTEVAMKSGVRETDERVSVLKIRGCQDEKP